MEWTEVNSTHLDLVRYDEETKVLGVIFKDGSQYEYKNVPPELVTQLLEAPSMGKFFAQAIRKSFSWTRVG